MKITYSNAQLQKIANVSLLSIKKRILSGLDKDDKEFKQYSSKPFVMPAGATTKGALKKLGKDGVQYFNRNNATWVLIKGGYLALKKARAPEWSGKPDLTSTGAMLRSMAITKIENNSFTIGFTRSEEALKMYWNILRGRNPMGLSPSDLRGLTELLHNGLIINE
jgi:hypothetical protein